MGARDDDEEMGLTCDFSVAINNAFGNNNGRRLLYIQGWWLWRVPYSPFMYELLTRGVA